MSLPGVILGSFGELCFALCLFMLAAVVGGSVASASLPRWQTRLLNAALFGLPGLCVTSALIVIAGYAMHAGAAVYGWYALPLAGVLAYAALVLSVKRQP